MAEVVVSPIVQCIMSLMLPCCAKHTNYLRKLQKKKKLLEDAKNELMLVRNSVKTRVANEILADPRKNLEGIVSLRLRRVETIEGEVEEVLKKADEQLNEGRCLGGCFPKNVCSNYKVGKSVAKMKASVDKLKDELEGFKELTNGMTTPSLVQEMNVESTVGMESMFDKVWRLINSTDVQAARIMGLYGQGGVGKTTLLEKINNEFHKISTSQHDFDYVVIFVLVSKPVNYEAIQKKIGERLGLTSDFLQGDGAEKIYNALRNRNFVLLLDDIWERVDLRRIGIPIDPSQGNSKLIFTTRSERVCGDMGANGKFRFKVECLPKDKALILFQEKVGEEALNSFAGARELAKRVAEECDGLPLALITIGRAMSTKKFVQEWTDAIITLQRYASEFKDMRDKVLPSLKLSYDYLNNQTDKSCFRYCALFPEDYSISINKLIDYWIAEGFLDGFDKLGTARDRGHTIIGTLKSACLLESSDEENHEKTHVKMHDVIRDLALWIVHDCRSSSDESSSSSSNSDNRFLVAVNDPCKKWKKAERIFWQTTTSGTTRSIIKEPKSPNLLTLIGGYCWPPSFFQHMPHLRVLDLSNNRSLNVEFPIISICKLRELQYLKLTEMFIKELPVEFKKLVKLKFLVLIDTYRLRKIPAGLIANLSKLQVLDIAFEDWELEDNGPSFSDLDGLKHLQEVPIMISTFVAFDKFLCNQKLQMVCTGLIFKKSDKSSSSSRRVLDLSNFKSLKDLNISGFSELEELVLYGSITDGGLLTNLEKLSLDCFPKLNNIQWTTTAAQPDLFFQSLNSIWISGCDALKDLTWVVNVQNLKELTVLKCEGLETVIEGTAGGGGIFERLETLSMSHLPKLESICRHALAFPFIETIRILECPELNKLPLDSGSNINNTLKRIEGTDTYWWNVLQWEDETIRSKFLPYYSKTTRG